MTMAWRGRVWCVVGVVLVGALLGVAGVAAHCSVAGVGDGQCQDITSPCKGRIYRGLCSGQRNKECCVLGPKIISTPTPPPVLGPCTLDDGTQGKCEIRDTTPCNGTYHSGVCPGGAKIGCCVPEVPKVPPGGPCSMRGVGSGVCQEKTKPCAGSYYPANCEGPSTYQCCIDNSEPPPPPPPPTPTGPAPPSGRDLNKDTIVMLKSFERFMPCTYTDVTDQERIGYGHLIQGGDPYTRDSCISEPEAEALLRADMTEAVLCVVDIVKQPLNCNEKGALVSWVSTVGCDVARESTLIKRLNGGDKRPLCSQLLQYTQVGGRVVKALEKRRQAECTLFRKPTTDEC